MWIVNLNHQEHGMIFIGNFLILSNQEKVAESERRHGEFSMIVDAPDNARAIDMFREKIGRIRASSDMFEGQCAIFFTQLLEFDHFPRHEAMMLNYRSWVGDPVLPFIGCTFPNAMTDNCRIHEWKNSRPEIDGIDERLFLEFHP